MDRYVILWATYPGMHFHNNLIMLQYMKHTVTLKLIYSAFPSPLFVPGLYQGSFA